MAEPSGGSGETRVRRLKQRLIGEGQAFGAIFLYIYVVLALFSVHEHIVLKEHQIDFTHYGFALVNAYVLAKVVLVGEKLHLGGGFEDRPLIYPILVKSALFGIALVAFHIVEKTIAGVWRGQTIAESIPGIGGGGLRGVIAIAAIVSVTLIPFFAFRSLMQVIGRPQLYALLFRRGRQDVIVEVKARLPTEAAAAATE